MLSKGSNNKALHIDFYLIVSRSPTITDRAISTTVPERHCEQLLMRLPREGTIDIVIIN